MEQVALMRPAVRKIKRGDNEVVDVVRPGPDRDRLPVDEAYGSVAFDVCVPDVRIAVHEALRLALYGGPIGSDRRAEALRVVQSDRRGERPGCGEHLGKLREPGIPDRLR